MKRPFNVLWEILVFAASLLLDVYVARNNLISNEIVARALNYWAFGAAWPVLIGIITVRALKRKQTERRLASVLTFGFVVGALVWSIFVLSEPAGLGLSQFFWASAGIFFAGLISAFLAAIWSYLLFWVLRHWFK